MSHTVGSFGKRTSTANTNQTRNTSTANTTSKHESNSYAKRNSKLKAFTIDTDAKTHKHEAIINTLNTNTRNTNTNHNKHVPNNL